jgi:serine/threonine-protein kinase
MTDPILDRLQSALAERYDLQREIGRGGMATVYLAEERHPRRHVAIKVFDPDFAPHLMRERFLREIDVVSKLAHPHIVPSALHYAHDQGIIHRDIKPENILLADGHAMVADFGIARAVGAAGRAHLTQTGFAMGTPAYMSPEQWAGSGEIDGRTDVFGLGCVVFEMLEGRLPPDGLARRRESVRQLLRRSQSGRHTPTGLRAALERALALRPDDRYPTAAAFGEALGSSGGYAIRLPAPIGGRKLAAAVTLALVVGIALAVGIVLPSRGAAGTPSRVVVSMFENQTGDPTLTPLGMMAADWITQGLAQTGLVEVVGTRTAMAAAAGADPSRPPPRAAEVSLGLAQETGAGIVVWGAYYLGDARVVHFQAQITDAVDGRLLRALDPVASSIDSPLVAVETLRQRVMGALATLFDERLSSWATAAAQPPSYDAYQEYIEGMTLFMQLRQLEGIQHLYRAAEHDSTFVTPLLFAAFAHATLGQFAATDSIAQIVNRSRERLSPFDRHLLDWTLAMTDGDFDRALSAVRKAVAISPGGEPLTLVGLTALNANRPRETLDAFQQMDPERGLMQGFFLYWHYIGAAHHLMGNHRRELAALRLGRVDELRDSLRTREPRPSSWAHGAGVPAWGDLLRLLALELGAHGHPVDGAALTGQAVDWYRQQPEDSLRSEAFRYGRLSRVPGSDCRQGRRAGAGEADLGVAQRIRATVPVRTDPILAGSHCRPGRRPRRGSAPPTACVRGRRLSRPRSRRRGSPELERLPRLP